MASALSEHEVACLDVAVSLLRRSDAYAASEPQLSRQYARQAYEMGCLSPRLTALIARVRIQMIVQNCDQHRMVDVENVTSSFAAGNGLRRLTKAGLLISSFIAALVLYSTPTVKAPDPSIKLAIQTLKAPL